MRARFNPQEFEPQDLDWHDLESQGQEPEESREAAPALRNERAWEQFGDRLPAYEFASKAVRGWFGRLMALMLPLVEDPGQLASKAAFVFGIDAETARANPENHAVLATDAARIVLAELAERTRVHEGWVRPEEFEDWMQEIAAATGLAGQELLQPVRIALTGAIVGPELRPLLLLIEDPAARALGIPSLRERVEQFVGV